MSDGLGLCIDGDWNTYPEVSEMYTTSVYAIYPCCLRDVCCDGDEERDGNVLEYKRPGPLIKIC